MWLGVGRRPVRTVCMAWKRVAAALVLIPVVVGLVLFASTAAVAVATAVITVLALWEYFALGEAIGHRAYRVWTIFCALYLILQQSGYHGNWLDSFNVPAGEFLFRQAPIQVLATLYSPETLFFFYILGLTVLTIFTRRPLVESLSAAGISSSALLLVAFPLSFAVRLHGIPAYGPKLLLFALVITWAGDTTAYFVGRAMGIFFLVIRRPPRSTLLPYTTLFRI